MHPLLDGSLVQPFRLRAEQEAMSVLDAGPPTKWQVSAADCQEANSWLQALALDGRESCEQTHACLVLRAAF